MNPVRRACDDYACVHGLDALRRELAGSALALIGLAAVLLAIAIMMET